MPTNSWTDAPVLRHAHAVLEPLQEAHAGALFEAAESPDTFRYFSRGPVPFTEAGMRAFIAFLLGPADTLPFAVHDATGRLAGITTFLDRRPEHETVEIGWTWYTPGVRGTRLNPACKLLLFGYAFETLGVHRVALKTDARNEQSQRAIARLGAQREGVLREVVWMPDGFRRSTVYFSILRPEWPAARAVLEQRLSAEA